MISKNKAKYFVQLSSKKQRSKHGEFLVEGKKMFEELVASKWEIVETYATPKFISEHKKLLANLEYEETDEKELTDVGNLESNNSVLSLVRSKQLDIANFDWRSNTSLILDNIKDPGNLGTIIRTAAWFGISNIICSKETVDLYNPKVIQSSMGAIFRCDVYYTDLEALLIEASSETTFSIFGAFLNGDSPQILRKQKQCFVVLGSESHGISEELHSYIDTKITIPKGNSSDTESLNVAIANAILCYELSND